MATRMSFKWKGKKYFISEPTVDSYTEFAEAADRADASETDGKMGAMMREGRKALVALGCPDDVIGSCKLIEFSALREAIMAAHGWGGDTKNADAGG